jgi:DNA repair photolyase
MGLLSSYRDRATLAAKLLQQGYPVLCSTHVDFFAKSNKDIGITILDIMQDLGIPYMLATKGGDRFIEFIQRSKPCVIYFSVATLSDRVSQSVEPNAPLPSERLRMIEAAIACGHKVVAGINPCVPDWIDDPLALATALKNAGVWGVISQPLHLNNNQIKQIPEQGQAALGERVMKQAKMRDRDPIVRDFNLKMREVCGAIGLELYRVGQNIRSDFYQPWKEIYPKLYPTGQDFVNHAMTAGSRKVISSHGQNGAISLYLSYLVAFCHYGIIWRRLRIRIGAASISTRLVTI